jgi:hypothetical protein
VGFAHNIDLDHSTCRRIIALLLSMAVLAERASLRSLPLQLLVFWLLRRGEAAALTLFPVLPEETEASHDAPVGDLIGLAARLRTLAMLLAQACPDGGTAETAAAENADPPCLARFPRCLARVVPDTS